MPPHLIKSHLTDQIIKAFFKVYNTLGYGFLEKVYENALALEIISMGLNVRQQQPIKVYYEERPVGDYIADLIVENVVIIEVKRVDAICEPHEAQLLNESHRNRNRAAFELRSQAGDQEENIHKRQEEIEAEIISV